MTATAEEILSQLRKIRYDLTAAQAKLTDVLNTVAALDLPTNDETRCPTCGIRCKGRNSLAEHLYVSHNGPLPPHWLEADRLAAT